MGMACIFGSTSGAIITAMVFLFELTNDYYIILPVILTVSISFYIRRIFVKDSLYKIDPSAKAKIRMLD
jgi:CIC family chloride channel protein